MRHYCDYAREHYAQLMNGYDDVKKSLKRHRKLERRGVKQVRTLLEMKRTSASDSDEYVRKVVAQSSR